MILTSKKGLGLRRRLPKERDGGGGGNIKGELFLVWTKEEDVACLKKKDFFCLRSVRGVEKILKTRVFLSSIVRRNR